ncbi:hypothetical protein HK096_005881 [Nowakowskiella sp. JEL0078]|nr:hypothetical protein HK096_005881 [Nowakowskiella sp. JEL0078]
MSNEDTAIKPGLINPLASPLGEDLEDKDEPTNLTGSDDLDDNKIKKQEEIERNMLKKFQESVPRIFDFMKPPWDYIYDCKTHKVLTYNKVKTMLGSDYHLCLQYATISYGRKTALIYETGLGEKYEVSNWSHRMRLVVVEIATKIGIRFIWIDTLCIPQGDSTDDSKKEKISLMSRMKDVYACCSVNIVMMSDDLVSSSQFISLDNRENIDPLSESYIGFAKESEWMVRSWTLQEQVLPRNGLYCYVKAEKRETEEPADDKLFICSLNDRCKSGGGGCQQERRRPAQNTSSNKWQCVQIANILSNIGHPGSMEQ